jgi:predicted nucleotidyltransferase
MATGEAHRTSDYDLLVVAQNLPLDVWERIDVLWRDKPLDVEVIGFRPKEIEEKIHRGLVLDALLLGRVLYGNVSGLQEKARHFVGEKKLVRTEAGYFREREARGE